MRRPLFGAASLSLAALSSVSEPTSRSTALLRSGRKERHIIPKWDAAGKLARWFGSPT